jgi:Holliday junction resolvasome RuvABC endonuclease subunit
MARYETRIHSLLGIIGVNENNSVKLGIEHYAYSAGGTHSDSTLKELGGILRRQLCHSKHNIVEIVPSQVKRIFAQQGNAKKNDMYKAFLDIYKLPDLRPLMNVDIRKNIMHPIDDMVDAFAVAMSVLTLN